MRTTTSITVLCLLLFACGDPPRTTSTYESATATSSGGATTTSTATPTESTTAGQNPAATTPSQNAVITTTPLTPPSATVTTAPLVAPAPPGPRFPLGGLRLLPSVEARGEDARTDLELREDGQLLSRGRLVGRLVGERVLDANGRTLAEVSPAGLLVLGGATTRLRITDEGTVQLPSGATLQFTEDGTPLATAPDGRQERGPLRVVGLRPELRRTAALLAVLAGTIAR